MARNTITRRYTVESTFRSFSNNFFFYIADSIESSRSVFIIFSTTTAFTNYMKPKNVSRKRLTVVTIKLKSCFITNLGEPVQRKPVEKNVREELNHTEERKDHPVPIVLKFCRTRNHK